MKKVIQLCLSAIFHTAAGNLQNSLQRAWHQAGPRGVAGGECGRTFCTPTGHKAGLWGLGSPRSRRGSWRRALRAVVWHLSGAVDPAERRPLCTRVLIGQPSPRESWTQWSKGPGSSRPGERLTDSSLERKVLHDSFLQKRSEGDFTSGQTCGEAGIPEVRT